MTVDKSEERIRRMFGEISPRYDFLNHLLSGGTDYYWRWRTVRAAPPVGGPILDVCTGTGDLALAYWKKGDGRVRVVGADFTHEMLRLANDKRAKVQAADARRGLSRSREHPKDARQPELQPELQPGQQPLVFIEADAQRLPFADDQFQIVSVAFGLRNVTNTELGLREMIRVCKPGGRVVVLEFSMPTNRLLGRFYRWYFNRVLPRIGQLLSRNRQSAYRYLPQSVSEFPQGEALAAIMRQLGLQAVRFQPLTFGIATLYYGDKAHAV